MMRVFVYSLLFPLLFVACTFSQSSSRGEKVQDWIKENGKLKVLCTTAMIADVVAQVGGDEVDVLTLIYGGLDPHTYEIVKGDDELIQNADIVFCNGLGLEHGPGLLQLIKEHPHSIALADVIQEQFPDLVCFERGQVDPHIWMDVSLWEKTLPSIEKELVCEVPNRAAEFHMNREVLSQQMLCIHQKIRELMEEFPSSIRYMVTSHDAFNYFARAYLATDDERERGIWHYRFAAPEGLAPEASLSASDIQYIIDYISQYNVTTLFTESNVSKASLHKILSVAEDKGLRVSIAQEPLYADAMEGPNQRYLDMMQHNAISITKHWR